LLPLLRFVLVPNHHNPTTTSLLSPTLRLFLAIFLSDDVRISGFRSWCRSVSSTYHNILLTASDRVSPVSLWARADGAVVDNLTSGARSTSPRAGVPAIVLLARQGSRAVPIILALSLSTHHIRVAKVPRWTLAVGHEPSGEALRVDPAWPVVPTWVDSLAT